MIKSEYWPLYLQKAIVIVYESKDMDEFNAKSGYYKIAEN